MDTSKLTNLSYFPLKGEELQPLGIADVEETAMTTAQPTATPPDVTKVVILGKAEEYLYSFAAENWRDPSKIDTKCQDAKDVLWSLGGTFKGCALWVLGQICPCFPRREGDGLKDMTGNGTACANKAVEKEFDELERCALHQLQMLYPHKIYHPFLNLPENVENFVIAGEASDALKDDPMVEAFALKFQLPKTLASNHAEFADHQTHLDEIAKRLTEKGFAACQKRSVDGQSEESPLLILNPKTHLCAALIYDSKSKKICIHFRDTAGSGLWENGTGAANWRANFAQGMGLLPKIYRDADLLAYSLKAAFGAENLLLIGYSLGGGLVSFAALRYLLPAVGINAAAPSPCHQRFYEDSWEKFAHEGIRYLSLKDDILSRVLDNPLTGGILPSAYPQGAQAFVFDDKLIMPEIKTACCGLIKSQVKAHSIVELLLSMRATAIHAGWRTLEDYSGDCLQEFYAQRVAGELLSVVSQDFETEVPADSAVSSGEIVVAIA